MSASITVDQSLLRALLDDAHPDGVPQHDDNPKRKAARRDLLRDRGPI